MIPKFKFWDKDEQYFIKDATIVLNQDGSVEGLEYYHSKLQHSVYNDISYYELIQSTGLKDLHDNEFFDKDVARDIDSEELGLVEYVNGAFVMKFASGDGADLYDVKDNFEIIGNQFEHPHLLKE